MIVLGCILSHLTDDIATSCFDALTLDEVRQQSEAPKLAGHDIMALERFAPDTRHMIVFDVLTHDSPIGWKGEKCRAFLTEQGYQKSLNNEQLGHIKIRNHAKVVAGHLYYDHKDREL